MLLCRPGLKWKEFEICLSVTMWVCHCKSPDTYTHTHTDKHTHISCWGAAYFHTKSLRKCHERVDGTLAVCIAPSDDPSTDVCGDLLVGRSLSFRRNCTTISESAFAADMFEAASIHAPTHTRQDVQPISATTVSLSHTAWKQKHTSTPAFTEVYSILT